MASKRSAKCKSLGATDVENKVRSQYTKLEVQLSRTRLSRAQNSRILRSHSYKILQQELSFGKREALRRISKFLANEILNCVFCNGHKTLQQSNSSKVAPGTQRVRMESGGIDPHIGQWRWMANFKLWPLYLRERALGTQGRGGGVGSWAVPNSLEHIKLSVNTLRPGYKSQLIDTLQGNNRCLFWEPHNTEKFILGRM